MMGVAHETRGDDAQQSRLDRGGILSLGERDAVGNAKDMRIQTPLSNTFRGINNYLKKECGYGSEDMLIWDDLWFWGFITQRSSANISSKRVHDWNEEKYWSIFTAPQDRKSIGKIKLLAKTFLRITKSSDSDL